MSATTNLNDGRIASSGPTDPLEQYEFTTVHGKSGQHTPELALKELHAKRMYRSVEDVTAVWPGCSDLANLIHRFINRRVVTRGDGSTKETGQHSLDITIVFTCDMAGRFRPVDVRLADVSIDRFDIKPGFWKINKRLEQLIDSQTTGIVTTQIPYRGRKRGSESPFC